MSRIGQLWTGAVAYVSLLVGAGLSVAGNLADTYRIRGQLTDPVDIVLAIGPPLATLLVAELFVSAWPRTWSLQTLRWVGMVTVGSLAAIVSWSHINELLVARGQNALVSILWPLAIDGLAVMAMAKLLAMRVHGHVATADTATADTWTPDYEHPDLVTADMDIMATRPQGDLDAWTSGYEDALSVAGQELATEAEEYVRTAREALPRRPRTADGGSHPADMVDMVTAWRTSSNAPDRADVVKLLAGHYGVSTRTVRRWLSALGAE